MKPNIRFNKTIWMAFILILLCLSHVVIAAEITTKYICVGTDYKTPVHILKSDTKKPVIMVISGTHGNEPAGIAATTYLKDKLIIKRGTLLIIPRSNIIACEKGVRSFPEDINLNRVYPGSNQGNSVEKIAYEIFNLMKIYDVDFLIDLHESREYYKVNSQNYGQTLVLDCCGESLLEMCCSIADELNNKIINPVEKFEAFVKPIKGSATYAASCQLNIPAIVFETCKKLPLSRRVEEQIQFTKIVLSECKLLSEEK